MAKKKTKTIESINDLTPDSANVNKGSERGAYMIDWSMTELGAGRSILADRSGNVLAGNKTLEAAAEHGFPVRVVPSDGKELIVVQRTDLDLNGTEKERGKARQMAIADNRSQVVSYTEDIEMLLSHQAAGIDLSPMWKPEEIEQLMARLTPQTVDELWKGMPEYNQEDVSGRIIVVHFEADEDVKVFAKRMEQAITDKTKSIWFPYKPREEMKGFIVEDES